MFKQFRLLPIYMICLLMAGPSVAESKRTGFQPRHLQALIGAMVADEDEYQGFDSNGEPIKSDEVFGTFLVGGGMVQLADGPSTVEFGLETGAFFAWKEIDTDYKCSSNGGLVVKVSSDFYMFEILMGGFTGWNVTNKFRVYASAGPSVVWGRMGGGDDSDEVGSQDIIDEDGNSIDWGKSESDISMGLYGRLGMEYRFGRSMVLGFSARYLDTELDFDSTTGKVDLKGTQWFLTLGRRY
jgi:hypothetical protein